MEERRHDRRQHGNRYVAAGVAEAAESQPGAIVIVHQDAGDAGHRAEDAGRETDRFAAETRKSILLEKLLSTYSQ